MSQSTESHLHDADRLIYAGLLWLSATCVFPMFEKANLDLPQSIGLHAFALAIPLLAVGLVTDYARKAGKNIPTWHQFVCVGGALACVVGFGSLLFHVSIIVGCVFAAGCILGLILVRRLR